MRELSLFTGAAGGLLGTHLLGWTPIGYVEWDAYCQQVIAARIRDGMLPIAPIFTDVREFIQSGAAAEYRGVADVVTGGFPCQPHSVAGKQLGADDPRDMWPAMAEVVRVVRPRYVFAENVPGILSSGYFGAVIRDLAACGYCVHWRILSAAEMGAPHLRKRLWIVAHANSNNGGTGGMGENTWTNGRNITSRCSPNVAHAQSKQGGRVQQPELQPDTGAGGWWKVEPPLGRVADGVADSVDQLRALGNGQVATVAAAAWRLLTGDSQ